MKSLVSDRKAHPLSPPIVPPFPPPVAQPLLAAYRERVQSVELRRVVERRRRFHATPVLRYDRLHGVWRLVGVVR